jgi:hypothetical protein
MMPADLGRLGSKTAMREQSRLRLAQAAFLVLALLFCVSGELVRLLSEFVFQPRKLAPLTLVTTDLRDPLRNYAAFPAAVVLAALGSFAWCRAARRAPYLQRLAILLGVALLVSLATAVVFRWRAFLWYAWMATITPGPPAMASGRIAWVPLSGGLAALVFGAALGMVGHLDQQIAGGPQAGDSP